MNIIKGYINNIFLRIRYINSKSKIKSKKMSRRVKIGRKVIIGKNVTICDNVEVGNYTYFNSQYGSTFIDSDVKFGSFCSVGPNVVIGLGNHNYTYISTHPFLYNSNYGFVEKNDNNGIIDLNKKTVIGNDVWIGANSNIKRGIKIGNGAIIGMNSVVTKDVPDYSIVVGNPARVIKYRFNPDKIEYLNELKWWDLSDQDIKKDISKFYDINKFKLKK